MTRDSLKTIKNPHCRHNCQFPPAFGLKTTAKRSISLTHNWIQSHCIPSLGVSFFLRSNISITSRVGTLFFCAKRASEKRKISIRVMLMGFKFSCHLFDRFEEKFESKFNGI